MSSFVILVVFACDACTFIFEITKDFSDAKTLFPFSCDEDLLKPRLKTLVKREYISSSCVRIPTQPWAQKLLQIYHSTAAGISRSESHSYPTTGLCPQGKATLSRGQRFPGHKGCAVITGTFTGLVETAFEITTTIQLQGWENYNVNPISPNPSQSFNSTKYCLIIFFNKHQKAATQLQTPAVNFAQDPGW